MKKILLNSDLGESFGSYKIGNDKAIIKKIDLANIACGLHAGDPVVMKDTVEFCKVNNVKIGAHPGYPDLQGFGRRDMDLSFDEVFAYVTYQIGALNAFCVQCETTMFHVKPHGQLYNRASIDESVARAIVLTVGEFDPSLKLVALANSTLADVAKQNNLDILEEFFVDRAYTSDGKLVSRSVDGAVIHDESIALERLSNLITTGFITSIDDKPVKINADTICVHGDTPEALQFVEKISSTL